MQRKPSSPEIQGVDGRWDGARLRWRPLASLPGQLLDVTLECVRRSSGEGCGLAVLHFKTRSPLLLVVGCTRRPQCYPSGNGFRFYALWKSARRVDGLSSVWIKYIQRYINNLFRLDMSVRLLLNSFYLRWSNASRASPCI